MAAIMELVTKKGGSVPSSRRQGFSLTEVLVVIAFLAIVAAISIPQMIGVFTGSSLDSATRNLNYLNGAVIAFNQSNWELVLTASDGSNDEQRIFDSLRYRDAANPAPGSPYLPSTATFVASGSSEDYRAQWNGRMFELLAPGTEGTGLDLMEIMGSTIQEAPTNAPVPPAS